MSIDVIVWFAATGFITSVITLSILSIHRKLNNIDMRVRRINNQLPLGGPTMSYGWHDPRAEQRLKEWEQQNHGHSQAAQNAYDEAREIYEKKKQEKQE